MATAIIGTGNIGGTLARHLVRGGEPVVLAAKDEANAAALAQELVRPLVTLHPKRVRCSGGELEARGGLGGSALAAGFGLDLAAGSLRGGVGGGGGGGGGGGRGGPRGGVRGVFGGTRRCPPSEPRSGWG